MKQLSSRAAVSNGFASCEVQVIPAFIVEKHDHCRPAYRLTGYCRTGLPLARLITRYETVSLRQSVYVSETPAPLYRPLFSFPCLPGSAQSTTAHVVYLTPYVLVRTVRPHADRMDTSRLPPAPRPRRSL